MLSLNESMVVEEWNDHVFDISGYINNLHNEKIL